MTTFLYRNNKEKLTELAFGVVGIEDTESNGGHQTGKVQKECGGNRLLDRLVSYHSWNYSENHLVFISYTYLDFFLKVCTGIRPRPLLPHYRDQSNFDEMQDSKISSSLKHNEFLKTWRNWTSWFWNYPIYKGGILNCYNWYANIKLVKKFLSHFPIPFVKSTLNAILDTFWKTNGLSAIAAACISCAACHISINNSSVWKNPPDVIWF